MPRCRYVCSELLQYPYPVGLLERNRTATLSENCDKEERCN